MPAYGLFIVTERLQLTLNKRDKTRAFDLFDILSNKATAVEIKV